MSVTLPLVPHHDATGAGPTPDQLTEAWFGVRARFEREADGGDWQAPTRAPWWTVEQYGDRA